MADAPMSNLQPVSGMVPVGLYIAERNRRWELEEELYYERLEYEQQHEIVLKLLASGRQLCEGRTIINIQIVAPRKRKRLWTHMGRRIET